MALTVGSLFSGIGGIDLGLERASMVTRWFCEIDPHCRNVLARHWPGLPIYGDITAVDWSGVERVDVLAGGFPCQPVSVAGRALAQADERWLWPAFRDAIGALRPRYVLVENVPGLLQRGLGIVLGDLAELGYDAEWECIPAAAVGAPHLRNRLWLVAYPISDQLRDEPRRGSGPSREAAAIFGHDGTAEPLAHTDSSERHERREHRASSREGSRNVANATRIGSSALRQEVYCPQQADGTLGSRATLPDADRGDAQGQLPQRHDQADGSQPAERPAGLFGGAGPSGEWSAEPDVGRVAHGVPHRVDRLRALGNAVVPQVVEWIGRRIIAFDEDREVSAA